MSCKYIPILFMFFMLSAGVVLAEKEIINLPAAGLTPQSPFYFLDQAGDWARLNIFTFNPVKKAKIKTEIAEERLAELNNVVFKTPDMIAIIERLETTIQKWVEEANNDAKRLDGQNRDVSNVVEKLEAFNLKQQQVLEKAMERIPDQAKDGVEKALENIRKQAEKHREILLKQKEKGFISEERTSIVIQNSLVNLKDQLEHRKERLEEIEDEALKKRLENIVKKKIEALEAGILDLESNESFKEARKNEKMRGIQKEVIKSVLEARQELKLRAATTEETLEQINEENFNLKEKPLICAQIITPARNVRTKECEIFKNSCLPKEWERDESCQNIGIDDKNRKGHIEKERRLKECGPQPGAPGNWQCKDGKWQLEKVINIIARQWSFTPETIIVKQGTKIILNIKSVDVTHGFSLPEFGISVDLSPGKAEKVEFIASKTGKFPFRCSVFCGAGHPKMTGLLVVE